KPSFQRIEERIMKLEPAVRSLLPASLGIAIVTGCAKVELPFFHSARPQPNVAAKATNAAPSPAALPDFSALVDRYGPAVVNVSTTGIMKINDSSAQLPRVTPGDPFSPFFSGNQPPMIPRDVPVRGV